MTDRELLEDAAKAAGHRIVEWATDGNGVEVAIIVRSDGDGFSKRPWQPMHENQMTDADGDALRLMVKLGISVLYSDFTGEAEARWNRGAYRLTEYGPDDPLAATRRAIVRAAAEIGRSKE